MKGIGLLKIDKHKNNARQTIQAGTGGKEIEEEREMDLFKFVTRLRLQDTQRRIQASGVNMKKVARKKVKGMRIHTGRRRKGRE
jgi:hypothetical protein